MKKLLLFAIFLAVLIPITASASTVTKIEPNDTYQTAMDLNPYFSYDQNPNSDGSWSVSVVGEGNGTKDFYSFSAQAGTYWFDVDNTSNVDVEIGWWDRNLGNLLGMNDDLWSLDAGSTSVLDSWAEFSFDQETEVVIAVSRFPSGFSDDFGTSGAVVGTGQGYTLNISTNLAPVPEPATMMLFMIGLLGLAVVSRKKV